MDKNEKGLIVSPPMFLKISSVESIVMKGFKCTSCSGNGWNWSYNEKYEKEQIACSFCKGSGRVKATVKVKWEKD